MVTRSHWEDGDTICLDWEHRRGYRAGGRCGGVEPGTCWLDVPVGNLRGALQLLDIVIEILGRG